MAPDAVGDSDVSGGESRGAVYCSGNDADVSG